MTRLTPDIVDLHNAAHSGHLSEVARLIEAGVSPDASDDEDSRPMHRAALRGDTGLVDLLVRYGAAFDGPECEDSLGLRPLHFAAFGGHLAVVDRLLKLGAVVDPVSNWDQTPLGEAASRGRSEVVDRLLAAGADPDGQGPPSLPGSLESLLVRPLFAALIETAPHTDVVDQLLAAGAAIHSVSELTPLAAFARHGDRCCDPERAEAVVRRLVGAGDDLNWSDEASLTPLHLAAINDRPGIGVGLLRVGADPERLDQRGRRPLDAASQNLTRDALASELARMEVRDHQALVADEEDEPWDPTL